MKIARYAKTVSFLLIIFVVCGLGEAGSNNLIVGQLTDNETDDIKPQVSGIYAAWQGQDPNGGDWEIYFYDSNSVMRVTDNNSDDVNPRISDSIVVWEGWDANGGDWEIFYFDGESVHQVTDNDYNDIGPEVSQSLIVWQSWDGNDWEISSAIIPAPVGLKVSPQTLNLGSKGKWITVQVRLPAGYNRSEVVGSSLLLLGEVPASKVQKGNGSRKVMVKFSRSAVQALLAPGAAVEVTLTGELEDGTPIAGSDTIRVIP
ncbi:MAG: hypothetical protein ACYSTJ_09265 [Planctomycetota bacterium]|jgi:hypothetical protein